MKQINQRNYCEGMRDAVPIALGYLAVSFTLGIAAKNVGIGALQATLMSFTNSTSAGEFAALTAIAGGATYMELALMQFVINLRYMLMSCSLSQKIDPEFSVIHRFLMGFGVTDEIFGISIARGGKLNPFYTYGAMSLAIPAWSLGTFLGVVLGNVLPGGVVSALSVALYGMFLAIIIPPARDNKIIAGLVVVSMAASFLFAKLPVVRDISSGMRVIILTVMIAGAAAVLFPIKEEEQTDDA
ncbi:MAG: AzlC family ABC transporter permease [Wujia sp.]